MKMLNTICMVGLVLGFTMARAQEPKKDETKSATPAPQEQKKPASTSAKEVAVIKTSMGEMVIEFWPDVAPKTVENFKTLAKKGFYDGTSFHRIIDGFMIQGGDPYTTNATMEAQWGAGGPGYSIKGETNDRPDRKHIRGVISMANSGSPDTAGSQFFICLAPQHRLDGGYTTFGIVIKGDDTLTKLGKVPVKPDRRGEPSRPVERVALETIKIVPADSVK